MADLFSSAPPVAVREVIAEVVRDGVQLALANSTEKAKSEFIIAPVLGELRRMHRGAFGLFSGVEFDVVPSRGSRSGRPGSASERMRRSTLASSPAAR